MENTQNIRVTLESERGTSHDPARVRVYMENQLIEEIIAVIEPQRGADYGWYPCVILKKQPVPEPCPA